MSTYNLAVLISGNGSNLQALIDAIAAQQLEASIAVVLSHRANAYGVIRAQQAGIPVVIVDHTQYASRQDFERAMVTALAPYRIDLVVLAGFMRKLTPFFIQQYAGNVINIHPSLLPKYPGLHTHASVLAAGDMEHGCTVHFVTEVLDGGPIIAQAKVGVTADDTVATLQERVQQCEHQLYWRAIACIAKGELRDDGEKRYFIDQIVPIDKCDQFLLK